MTEALDLAKARSLLVIKPSSFGDVIHTLPAVHFIKRAHPHLALSWLINPEWRPLLEDNPDVAEAIPFPRSQLRGPRNFPKAVRWARQLRKRLKPDVALDFQGLLRSALIGRAVGARWFAGMSDAREGARLLHRQRVDIDPHAHAVDRSLAFIRALGVGVDDAEATFPLPRGERPSGLGDFADDYLLLHPFSRGAGKSFSVPDVVAFCQRVQSNVVIAGRADEAVATSLSEAAVGVSLINRTSIAQLIWLLRNARFVVSVDSGPMHLAAACHKRLLGIHTWSDPRKVGPYWKDCWIWKAGRILRRGELDDDLAAKDHDLDSDAALQIADFASEAVRQSL